MKIFLFLIELIFSFSHQTRVDLTKLEGKYDPSCKTAVCDNQTIIIPESVVSASAIPTIIPSSGDKRIEINLANQRLYAFEGDKKVYDFLISSGKWHHTPPGIYHIWIKLRYTRMTGGSKVLHTFYDLPNVPYTMYFYGGAVTKEDGYGIHGTYWHHNFGHPMSHGCINLKTEDAAVMYYWADPDLQGKQSITASTDNPGTEVVIYGNTPAN